MALVLPAGAAVVAASLIFGIGLAFIALGEKGAIAGGIAIMAAVLAAGVVVTKRSRPSGLA